MSLSDITESDNCGDDSSDATWVWSSSNSESYADSEISVNNFDLGVSNLMPPTQLSQEPGPHSDADTTPSSVWNYISEGTTEPPRTRRTRRQDEDVPSGAGRPLHDREIDPVLQRIQELKSNRDPPNTVIPELSHSIRKKKIHRSFRANLILIS